MTDGARARTPLRVVQQHHPHHLMIRYPIREPVILPKAVHLVHHMASCVVITYRRILAPAREICPYCAYDLTRGDVRGCHAACWLAARVPGPVPSLDRARVFYPIGALEWERRCTSNPGRRPHGGGGKCRQARCGNRRIYIHTHTSGGMLREEKKGEITDPNPNPNPNLSIIFTQTKTRLTHCVVYTHTYCIYHNNKHPTTKQPILPDTDTHTHTHIHTQTMNSTTRTETPSTAAQRRLSTSSTSSLPVPLQSLVDEAEKEREVYEDPWSRL
jgi:hypothetical protein